MGRRAVLPQSLRGHPYAAAVYAGCLTVGTLMAVYAVVFGWVAGDQPLPAFVVGFDVAVAAVCFAVAAAVARRRIVRGRHLEMAASAVLCVIYWSNLAELVGYPARAATLTTQCCLIVVGAGVVIHSRWALCALVTGALVTWTAVVTAVDAPAVAIADWAPTWVITVAIAFAAQLIRRTERGVGRSLRRTEQTLSWRDALTGLPNRRGFAQQTDQLVALARRRDERVWCAFVDVDHFKSVNDVLGHETGDDVLAAVAAALRLAARTADLPARWGGDEFVLVGLGPAPEGPDLQQRLVEHLRRLPASVTDRWQPAVTVGVADGPVTDVAGLHRLVYAADRNMYDRRRATRPSGTPPPGPPATRSAQARVPAGPVRGPEPQPWPDHGEPLG
jgi:diguanylate cyclase (GGDEF)-like protein